MDIVTEQVHTNTATPKNQVVADLVNDVMKNPKSEGDNEMKLVDNMGKESSKGKTIFCRGKCPHPMISRLTNKGNVSFPCLLSFPHLHYRM